MPNVGVLILQFVMFINQLVMLFNTYLYVKVSKAAHTNEDFGDGISTKLLVFSKCFRAGFWTFLTFKYRGKGDTNSCKSFCV